MHTHTHTDVHIIYTCRNYPPTFVKRTIKSLVWGFNSEGRGCECSFWKWMSATGEVIQVIQVWASHSTFHFLLASPLNLYARSTTMVILGWLLWVTWPPTTICQGTNALDLKLLQMLSLLQQNAIWILLSTETMWQVHPPPKQILK